MKILISYFFYFLLRFALFLRYRINVKGLTELKRYKFEKPGGILFLANHPAQIDPCILLAVLWPSFKPHPVAIQYLFQKPVIGSLLRLVGALPVPDFGDSSNSFKKKQIEDTYKRLKTYLQNRENLLIYPAGGLKTQGEERIGGASGIHQILQMYPNANVVMIRTMGLWGSSFSKALTGKTPEIIGAFLNGLKILVKNAFFFAPRREVSIEIEPASKTFPSNATRRDLNRYLEEWFNAKGAEPLTLVSYSFWTQKIPEIPQSAKKSKINYGSISESIKLKVQEEIAQLTNVKGQDLKPEQDLARDLGLDSLDQAQLVVMLKESFGVAKVRSSDLVTVESVMAYAAGLIKDEEEEEEEITSPIKWESDKGRPKLFVSEGETIPEAFLNTCERMGDFLACADALSGEVSYKRLKLGVILMAQKIAEFPEERIGILLPASVAVNVIILATLLAGKIPVMLNWTLGSRNLKAILDQTKIKKTISSWKFLDRLENVDLNGLDEQMILVEDMKRELTITQKIKGILLSKKKPEKILNKFNFHAKGQSQAVILFTSGTESIPKGVPLSHENILINLRDAFQYTTLGEDVVLLGSLPPFHSFGFSVTGLFPFLTGIRVAYSPNPTDGRRLASSIERWKVTMICLAPTFLKNILRVASKDQIKTLQLIVLGAEKPSEELFEKISTLNPNATIMEGYGITECAPILTLTPQNKERRGVGLPLPHVELKIVNPETREEEPLKKEGLILAKGPNVFNGYLDPTLPSPFVEMENQKWYVTGDLGYLDEKGFLTLSGRLKRFVKIGAEMISLNAIEETLLIAVKDLGFEIPQEAPSLAIIAIEESGKKGEIHLFTIFPLAVDETNRQLKIRGMSNLIKISSVTQVPFIPLLGTGKVDYRAIKSKYFVQKTE